MHWRGQLIVYNKGECLYSWRAHHSTNLWHKFTLVVVFLVISLQGMQWKISVSVFWGSPDTLVWWGWICFLCHSWFSKAILTFNPLMKCNSFYFNHPPSVTVFWGWTIYPSASYVACSAVHRAPARSPLSWPSCPQSPPTASCVMRVAADGRCICPSALTGNTRPVRRTPSSVSWHAPQEGTALPACLYVARPAPGTPCYSPMVTQWTWVRWAASTLAWVRASTATSSPTTTRVTGPALGNRQRRTCTPMWMLPGRHSGHGKERWWWWWMEGRCKRTYTQILAQPVEKGNSDWLVVMKALILE